MAEEIGQISVGLSLNDAGFNSSVSGINRSLKVLGAELGSIRAKGSEWGNSVEGLSQRQDALGRTLQVQEAKVSQLRDAYAKSAAETGEYSEKTQRLAQQLNKAVGEFNRTETELNGVKQALAAQQSEITQTETKWNKLSQSMQEAGEKVSAAGQKMQDIGSSLSTGVTAPLLALGAGAVKVADDFDSSQGRIQASLGLTEQEAEKVNEVAGNLWRDAFGEDLKSAADGVATVAKNMKDIPSDQLENVAKQAFTVSDAFDQDINEVTRTANQLMKQFGIDSTQAFDLMTKGFQSGLDFSGELLDTLNEYAPQFSALGFSGEEFFNTLAAGADAGAFNLDKVGDAVKEFNIRAKDGSKTTGEAFKALGMDADEMAQTFAKGGPEAQKAFTKVVEELAKIEDPVKRNTIGVGLFGTQFEDLEADVIAAMGTTTGEFDKVSGATDKAGKALYDNFGSRLTTAFRELQTALLPLGEVLLSMAEAILPKLSAAVQTVSEWFAQLSPAGQMITTIFGLIAAALGPVIVIFGVIVGAIGNIITAIGPLLPYLSKLKTAFTVIRTAMLALTGPIGIAIALITTLGIIIYQNWDAIAAKTSELFTTLSSYFSTGWNYIKTTTSELFATLKSYFTTGWDYIKQTTSSVLTSISNFIKTIWDGIKAYFTFVLNFYKTLFTTIWNAIKTVTTSVFNAVKSFITTLWDGVKSYFTNVLNFYKNLFTTTWNAIKSVTSTVFNAVKSFINTVFEGIRSFFTTILNTYKTLFSAGWNAIKTTTTTVFNAIRSFISNVWEGIRNTISNVLNSVKSTVSSAWSNVKSTTTTLVNGAKAAVEKVFNSFKSTIDTAMNNVKTAVESGWNKAKSFLEGIDLTSIGKDIVNGLVDGIRSKFEAVKKAAEELAEKVKSAIKGVMDINSPSKVTTQYGQWTGEGFANGIQKSSKKAEAQAKAMAKGVSEAIKNAEVKFDTNKINADQYIAALKRIDAQHKLSAEQSRKVQSEIYAAQKEKAKEAAAEAKAAEEFYKKLDKINDDYVAKVKATRDQLKATEKALTDEYKKELAERKAALTNFASIFDEITPKTDVSGDQLIANLGTQVDALKQYATSINALKGRGLSQTLLEELENQGPKAAAEIAALASLNDAQLAEYQRLYDEKARIAAFQASKEMTEERAELARKIQAERDKAEKTVLAYKESWLKQINALKAQTIKEMGELTPGMQRAGKNAIEGMIEGMKAMKGPLMEEAKALAAAVEKTIKSALKIKSPSRLMRDEVGKMIPAGVAVGIEGNMGMVAKAAQALSQVASGSQMGNVAAQATRNYNNSAVINVYSPSANPIEIQRAQRQEQRRLAAEWGV